MPNFYLYAINELSFDTDFDGIPFINLEGYTLEIEVGTTGQSDIGTYEFQLSLEDPIEGRVSLTFNFTVEGTESTVSQLETLSQNETQQSLSIE